MNCPGGSFYLRPTDIVAQELIGKKLVRTVRKSSNECRVAGIIVETEAYGHTDDGASHARMGPTGRNAIMFGRVGKAYVYFTYGSHYCVNVSARSKDRMAGAVLIRAIEPTEGIEVMKKLRDVNDPFFLASGPGRLTQALNITSRLNGVDMTDPDSDLHIEFGRNPGRLAATPRIGISRAAEKKWRFVDASSLYISKRTRSMSDDPTVN